MYIYIGSAHAAQLYAYAYFEYAYACKEHTYAYMPRKPNLEKQEQQTEQKQNY